MPTEGNLDAALKVDRQRRVADRGDVTLVEDVIGLRIEVQPAVDLVVHPKIEALIAVIKIVVRKQQGIAGGKVVSA
jgi:hypothetical protein